MALGQTKPPSPAEKAFERKIQLSKWALLFEQLWPRIWLALGLGILFIALSLTGMWQRLPELPHKLVLGLFAVGFLVALVAIVRVRWPAREEAIRRVERLSGIGHRPASSYEDTLTLNADDARTAALWKAHRARLARLLQKLRVGPPSPRTDRYDPFAVRALLLLCVLILAVIVGDSASDRLWSAFRFGPIAKGAEARLDAWVTPPAYTGKAPIMLADGAQAAVLMHEKAGGPIEVPAKSLLIIRATGNGHGTLALEVAGSDGSGRKRLEAPAPANPHDVAELRLELAQSGTVTAFSGGTRIASWPFQVIPDHPPKIALTKDPERTPRGSLKLSFKVEDDYGVVGAEARISRLEPKDDKSSTAWARQVNKGPRLPHERPPALTLRLPRAYPKQAEGQSFHELAEHPWAGMRVKLTLMARDLAGQVGKSEPIEMVLPERTFRQPLARAIVEQRRRLVADSRNRLQVARAIDALTLEPEEFIEDLQVYLGLRSAYWRLQREPTRQGINSVVAQLWNIALRVEDGNLSDAERALREIQERLSKAIEEGASDEEIQRLMQELRQALAQFLEQLMKQAEGRPIEFPRGLGENQFITPRDLEQMLRNLENMARSGNRDLAQQMLSQLRDLLDRLQSGRMADTGQQQRLGQMMDEFGNLIGRQQKLLDDTFGHQRRMGERGQPGQRGQKGPRGQQGQQGQQGQGPGDMDGELQGLGDRQRELRELLGRLQRGLREFGVRPPGQLGGAGEAMERAERALREGDLDTATEEEGRALDQLRQGARSMAEQMLRQLPSQYGLNDGQSELDPLGRPPQRTDGPDPGLGVKVPDQIDVQRAREILEELRRRLGERGRPPIELDYLERLLKRF
jgi:uncharacterized protein (TIGR02302 family)